MKRNCHLMPAMKWLRLLLDLVSDKYEHLVRYYGYYSNRSRGARRRAGHFNKPIATEIVPRTIIRTIT